MEENTLGTSFEAHLSDLYLHIIDAKNNAETLVNLIILRLMIG